MTSSAPFTVRIHRSPLVLIGVVVGALISMALAAPPAFAAGSTPKTATPITAIPFSDYDEGYWSAPEPVTDAANAAISAECNGGGPMYRVRWYSYKPQTVTSVHIEGRMDTVTGSSMTDDEVRTPLNSGVAVVSADLKVIDCERADTVPASGVVKLAAGVQVYIVQFVHTTPDFSGCTNEFCYSTAEAITVQQTDAVPSNDDWWTALPITSLPYDGSVDATAARRGPGDGATRRDTCGYNSGEPFLTHSVWWTLTPAETGRLQVYANSGSLSVAELTPTGPRFLPLDCPDGNVLPPLVEAGKTYLLEGAWPHYPDNNSDQRPGEGGVWSLLLPVDLAVAKPDLVVTNVVSSPASPKAGDPVSFRATIKNQGTAPTQGGVIHGVAFQVDGVTKSWSDTFNASLAPGRSVTVTTNGGPAGAPTWPATAGSHTVAATVDDVNRIPGETIEYNNTRKLALTVGTGPARPDLVVSGVSWTPANPAVGAPVTFRATIKNQGTAATPAGIVHGVAFKVDGVTRAWSDTSTAALAPGASTTLTASGGPAGKATWPATTGPHAVEAIVDDVNRIKTESDETNNSSTVPLNLGPTVSRPDVVITGLSWTPTSPTAGAPVTLTATVKNVGTRSIPVGTVIGVSFRPNGKSSGATYSDTYAKGLRPGEFATLTANGGGIGGTWRPPAGATPVTAVVDDIFRFAETNEANNTLTTVVSAN